jgi:hypothetical protein
MRAQHGVDPGLPTAALTTWPRGPMTKIPNGRARTSSGRGRALSLIGEVFGADAPEVISRRRSPLLRERGWGVRVLRAKRLRALGGSLIRPTASATFSQGEKEGGASTIHATSALSRHDTRCGGS